MSDDLTSEEIDLLRRDAREAQERLKGIVHGSPAQSVDRNADFALAEAMIEALKIDYVPSYPCELLEREGFLASLRRLVLDTPESQAAALRNAALARALRIFDASPKGHPPMGRATIDFEDQRRWRFRSGLSGMPDPVVMADASRIQVVDDTLED